MEFRRLSGKDEFLTREKESRVQLDAWKSGDGILQKRYIDNVLDVPAAKVLQLDRQALEKTVKNRMNTTETVQEQLRFVSDPSTGGFA